MAGAIAVLLVKLLDPIGFGTALIIVLASRQKWIILVAAVISAVAVETLLALTQYMRTWGQGLPAGLIVGLIHAGLVFLIRAKFFRGKRQSAPSDPEASA